MLTNFQRLTESQEKFKSLEEMFETTKSSYIGLSTQMIELKNENIEMYSLMEELRDEKTELQMSLDVARKAAQELSQLKVRNFEPVTR